MTETDKPWGAVASRTAHNTPAYKAFFERGYDWARQKKPLCPTNRSIPNIVGVLRTVYGVCELCALALYLDDTGVYPGYLSPHLAVVQLGPGCI